MKSLQPLFDYLRYRFMKWRINREIVERIFPHLRRDRNFGYLFRDEDGIDEYTRIRDVRPILDRIEMNIAKMPEAYGRSFRYVMHTKLNAELRRYEEIARNSVRSETCAPRLIATRT